MTPALGLGFSGCWGFFARDVSEGLEGLMEKSERLDVCKPWSGNTHPPESREPRHRMRLSKTYRCVLTG